MMRDTEAREPVMSAQAANPSRQATKALVRRRIGVVLRRVGFWFSVAVILSPAVFVFLWMLSLGLKNEIDNLTYPPVFIPSPPTLARSKDFVVVERLILIMAS